jgi:hypothetical protein
VSTQVLDEGKGGPLGPVIDGFLIGPARKAEAESQLVELGVRDGGVKGGDERVGHVGKSCICELSTSSFAYLTLTS